MHTEYKSKGQENYLPGISEFLYIWLDQRCFKIKGQKIERSTFQNSIIYDFNLITNDGRRRTHTYQNTRSYSLIGFHLILLYLLRSSQKYI